MLKETETEETIVFCHIFIIGGISIVHRWHFNHWPPAPLAMSVNLIKVNSNLKFAALDLNL